MHITETVCEDVTWIQLAQDKNLWLVSMYTAIKYVIPYNTDGLLSYKETFNFFLVCYLLS